MRDHDTLHFWIMAALLAANGVVAVVAWIASKQ